MQKRLASINVLVVDDSKDNRILMNLLLRHEGAAVYEAASGEEALTKVTEHDFAIVLMDIQMPSMDGYETLKALQAQVYSRPVIALTAHAMKEERRKTSAAGFSDHVTKPVDKEVLVERILRLIHVSEAAK